MREQHFVTELMRSLRTAGFWCYKIPDSPASLTKAITKFTLKKPFDIVATLNGTFVAIECKQIKKWEAFKLSDMRESQVDNLTGVRKRGGKSFVFLNIRITSEENRLIIFEWGELYRYLKASPLPHNILKGMTFIQGEKGGYDLTPFRELVKNEDY